MKRILLFGVMAAVIWTADNWWLSTGQAEMSARIALNQFNDSAQDARELRLFQSLKDSVNLAAALATVLAGVVTLGPVARRWFKGTGATALGGRIRNFLRGTAPVIAGLATLWFTGGCVRSYDRPEYVEIDTSETGFLIPLEGDNTQQAKFQSEEYLKERKVAAKRVQITHRWSQEGRMTGDGRWIPTVRLVKVNRSPITREWISPEIADGSGSIRPTANDQAIWIESSDSVGFSMGFTCTAFISEDDAAKFLNWYPTGSLAEVMDHEVRARIQEVSAEVAAKYSLDVLRSKKQEISDAVKHDLTNFFSARGITITTVGMFGGMTYENPAIQKAIDETFIAQQLKVVAEAKYEAQERENARVELEADAVAERARREAQGQADARMTGAKAEADAIREINQAALETQNNPLLLQLKTLDVEKTQIERWDGHFPQWWMGGGGSSGGPNLLLQVAPPPTARN